MTCVLALGAAAPSGAALAASKPPAAVGFSITPVKQSGFFRFATSAGHSVAGRLLIRNLTSQPRVVGLSASDMATADLGGVSFPPGAPSRNGTWLALTQGTVRLGPHERTFVSFRVAVPKIVTGGEHYAGIVAVDAAQLRAAHAPARAAGVSLRHVTRLAMPILVTTPGPLTHHLALTDIRFGVNAAGSSLRIGLRNDGTTITRTTSIQLNVNGPGHRTFAIDERLGDFLPQTAISFPAALRGRLTGGTYRVTGTIRPHQGPPLRVDRRVTFTPQLNARLKHVTGHPAPSGSAGPSALIWLALVAALGVALAALIAYVRLRRRLAAQSTG